MNVAEEYKVPIKANRGWSGLSKQSKDLYKARYFQPDEDYELWLDRICRTYTDNREHRGRMKQYFRNYWFHPATPVSANGGLPKKGLPVSCFVQSVGDSKEGILSAWDESFNLGSRGAGIGTYWGRVREVGAKVGISNNCSSGIIPFLKVDEAMTLAVSQGGCYSDDTEILTENGWMLFDDLIKEANKGNFIKVAQVEDNKDITFVKPTDYIKYYVNEELYHFKDTKNIDLLVTANHNMVFEKERRVKKESKVHRYKSNILEMCRADEYRTGRNNFMLNSGKKLKGKNELSFRERFLIAYQADGTYVKNSKTACMFRFKKERKAKRLDWLLEHLDYKVTKTLKKDGVYEYYIQTYEENSKIFDWVDIENVTSLYVEQFIEELMQWDGNQKTRYSTTVKYNVDVIQALCSVGGLKSYVTFRDRPPKRQRLYYLQIKRNKVYFGTEKLRVNKVQYEGNVYCVTVPTHRLIVRRNGRTLICGNSRRASKAVYLPVWHPEIEEFVSLKDATGDPNRRTPQLFTGIVIDDKFIEAVEKREKYDLISPKTNETVKQIDAFDLWLKILEQRMTRGVPYLLFVDNVNNQRPEEYIKEGFKVETSQLCVAPETKILTDKGYKVIKDLANTEQRIWNGKYFEKAYVAKTNDNAHLLKIETTGGTVECTDYHKFYVQQGYTDKGKIVEKRAAELNVGDKLIKFALPVIEGYKELALAYENGFYSGDGYYCKKQRSAVIYLIQHKKALLNYFNGYTSLRFDKNDDRFALTYHNTELKDKFFVPCASYNIQSRLNWLAGLLDSDGALVKNGETQSFQISNINYEFLHETLMMLQTLGVRAKLTKNKEAQYTHFKNIRGKDYISYCQPLYRILIGETGVQTLLNLGLKTKRLQPKLRKPNRSAEQFIKVTAIIDENRYDETYCFNAPETHLGMFNGLNLGNCNEIVLHTAPDYSNICILSSINLEYYDEFSENEELYKQFIEDVHRFLDNVLTDFINNAKNIIGFEKVIKAAEYERNIGIGVMGLHYLFQKQNIPFDSLAAKFLNAKIFRELRELLEQSNIKLANEKGANPLSKKYNINRRNTHLMALAPTASISTLCNRTSPGIEPVVTNVFTHKIDNGAYIVKNRYLEKLLKELGKNTEEIWTSILANGGSVQHLDFLTEEQKEVFKTAFEINQQKLLDLAADRQKYIDQSQSLNIFLKPGVDVEYIYDLHMFAWQQGIKGLYYIRSDAPKKVGVLEFKSANDVINEVANQNTQKIEECIWCQ